MPIVLLDERDKAELQEQIDRQATYMDEELSSKINRNDKRITNLEQGITPDPFETDESVAYEKEVPSNALPYAEIEKIGGMSYASNNLFDLPWRETTTKNGLTMTFNADKTVTVNGTATEQTDLIICDTTVNFEGECWFNVGLAVRELMGWGTYWATPYNWNSQNEAYDTGGGVKNTFSKNDRLFWKLTVLSGITLNNVVFKPMVNRGDAALPYEPYFEGIRDSKVTEIKSIGKNKVDMFNPAVCAERVSAVDDNTIRITANTYYTDFPKWTFKGKPNTQYTISFGTQNPVDCTHIQPMKEINGKTEWLSAVKVGNNALYTVTSGTDGLLTFGGGGINSKQKTDKETVEIINLQIEEGSTATEYAPYMESSLPIAQEIQALDGYGLGASATCNNHIDFEKKQYVKACRRMTITSTTADWISWEPAESNSRLQITVSDKAAPITNTANLVANIPVTDAPVDNYTLPNQEYSICGYPWMGTMLFALVPNCTTREEALAYLDAHPIEVVYELATPEITDLSNILTDDNMIEVEGNGTITFENEHKNAVPSTITYMLKGVSE